MNDRIDLVDMDINYRRRSIWALVFLYSNTMEAVLLLSRGDASVLLVLEL